MGPVLGLGLGGQWRVHAAGASEVSGDGPLIVPRRPHKVRGDTRMRLGVMILVGALLLLGPCVPDGPCHAAGPTRPNVVLIIADDMAWDDCGAYGKPKVRTPHIDRLAREGMRFDRAFVTASSCSPSRSSILTGRYPHATDAEELHWPLPREQVTFVEALRAAGYWTA